MTISKFSAAPAAYDYPLLIKRLLTSAQRFEQNNTIVYRGEKQFSYQEFYRRVCKLANALTAIGVKQGDVVAVLDWDSHRYLECYFAIPMIGAILHTVNPKLSPDQVVFTMNHAEDKVAIVNDDFLPLIEGVKGHLNTLESIVQTSDAEQPIDTTLNVLGHYEALLSEVSAEFEFPDFDENTIATLFYTTGTTGDPKGVFFSHRQLVLHTLHLINAVNTCDSNSIFNQSCVYMPVTPMFHVHAWGMPYAATMLGLQQVYPGRYEPNLLTQLIRDYNVSFSHCVPTILQMILECDEAKKTDFSNWKVIIGGSALNQGLALKAIERGIEPLTGYGMSETCPVLSLTKLTPEILLLSPEDQVAFRVKTGVPTDLVDMQIWDDNGDPLPHDGKSKGEIVVRAPWLTQAYYKQSEKSSDLWKGGWLHTGDVAVIHPTGYVEIRDRIKDVIKTGGEWISSLELENLISQSPAVASVAVVGVPDEKWGERPHALVSRANHDCTTESIQRHLKQFVDAGKIEKWAIPQSISFVDDIPVTSVGKIDKKKIRQELLSKA